MVLLQALSAAEWVPIVTGSGGALVILCVVSWKLWKRVEKKDADLDAQYKAQVEMLIKVNKEGDALFQKQIETTESTRRSMEQLNMSLAAVVKVMEAQNVTLDELRKGVQSNHVAIGIIQGIVQQRGVGGGSSPDLRG
jgi:hypothetical protein